MAAYAQQVVVSTGQPDWRSRIEEDGAEEGWGRFVRGLKGLIGRGAKFADVSLFVCALILFKDWGLGGLRMENDGMDGRVR